MDENIKSAGEVAEDLDELADDISGEEGIWFWEKMYRRHPEFYYDGGLTEEEVEQIGKLFAEYRAAQKAKEEEREKRRLEEEEADEIMADFYLRELKKLMRFRRSPFAVNLQNEEFDSH